MANPYVQLVTQFLVGLFRGLRQVKREEAEHDATPRGQSYATTAHQQAQIKSATTPPVTARPPPLPDPTLPIPISVAPVSMDQPTPKPPRPPRRAKSGSLPK